MGLITLCFISWLFFAKYVYKKFKNKYLEMTSMFFFLNSIGGGQFTPLMISQKNNTNLYAQKNSDL